MIIGADIKPSEQMPIPYLGNDEDVLAKYFPDEYDIQVTLVYTSDVNLQLRKRIIERYKNYFYHSSPLSFFSITLKTLAASFLMPRSPGMT